MQGYFDVRAKELLNIPETISLLNEYLIFKSCSLAFALVLASCTVERKTSAGLSNGG